MVSLPKIVNLLDSTLRSTEFEDISLNGLQVEGNSEVSKVCVAVDACQDTIDKTAELGAQLLIVHHGLFWDQALAVSGAHKRKLSTLLNKGISLYASHLPLDAHPELGNNFCLAKFLGFEQLEHRLNFGGQPFGCFARNPKNLTLESISSLLSNLTGATEPHCLNFGKKVPNKIMILTGSAAQSLYSWQDADFDTLITGEPRQFAYHYTKENSLNAIFAGHYATETFGVIELGKFLQKKFHIEYNFVDFPTGI